MRSDLKNHTASPARRPATSMADIATHEQRFDRFAEGYLNGPHSSLLDLKYRHSRQVLAHARAIVGNGHLEGKRGRAALLAALYHDVGRFPQVVRWHTFSDAVSENHGALGVRVLSREQLLADEPAAVRRMVLAAVGLHNRYALPQGLPEPFRTVTYVVRDADKLDIMRIMAEHINAVTPDDEVVLRVRHEPDKWSPCIARMVLEGRVPGYADLVYVNDFRMLLGTWLEDLHFPYARARMAASGYVEAVLAGLPDVPGLRAVRSHFEELLEKATHAGSEPA